MQVPKDRPAVIVTAMACQNGSGKSGMTPNTVVAAPKAIGRARVLSSSPSFNTDPTVF